MGDSVGLGPDGAPGALTTRVHEWHTRRNVPYPPKQATLHTGLREYLAGCEETNISPISAIVTNLDKDVLNLSHIGLRDSGMNALSKALSTNQTIEHLNVSDNGLTFGCLSNLSAAIRANSHHIKITKLDLSRNNLGARGARILGEILSSLSRGPLSVLNLSHCEITDTGCSNLAESISFSRSLTEIDLSYCSIGMKGAAALADCLRTNNVLQHLNLAFNCLTDEAISVLSNGLKENKSLLTLDLSNNKIGNAAAASLSEALKTFDCALETLNISCCRMNDAACAYFMPVLESTRKLQNFSIAGNSLSESQIKAILKKAMETGSVRYLGINHPTALSSFDLLPMHSIFTESNPTGHYKLNLLSEEDLSVLRKLDAIVSSASSSSRNSEFAGAKNYRNVFVDFQRIKLSNSQEIMSSGIHHGAHEIEFDFVSRNRNSCSSSSSSPSSSPAAVSVVSDEQLHPLESEISAFRAAATKRHFALRLASASTHFSTQQAERLIHHCESRAYRLIDNAVADSSSSSPPPPSVSSMMPPVVSAFANLAFLKQQEPAVAVPAEEQEPKKFSYRLDRDKVDAFITLFNRILVDDPSESVGAQALKLFSILSPWNGIFYPLEVADIGCRLGSFVLFHPTNPSAGHYHLNLANPAERQMATWLLNDASQWSKRGTVGIGAQVRNLTLNYKASSIASLLNPEEESKISKVRRSAWTCLRHILDEFGDHKHSHWKTISESDAIIETLLNKLQHEQQQLLQHEHAAAAEPVLKPVTPKKEQEEEEELLLEEEDSEESDEEEDEDDDEYDDVKEELKKAKSQRQLQVKAELDKRRKKKQDAKDAENNKRTHEQLPDTYSDVDREHDRESDATFVPPPLLSALQLLAYCNDTLKFTREAASVQLPASGSLDFQYVPTPLWCKDKFQPKWIHSFRSLPAATTRGEQDKDKQEMLPLADDQFIRLIQRGLEEGTKRRRGPIQGLRLLRYMAPLFRFTGVTAAKLIALFSHRKRIKAAVYLFPQLQQTSDLKDVIESLDDDQRASFLQSVGPTIALNDDIFPLLRKLHLELNEPADLFLASYLARTFYNDVAAEMAALERKNKRRNYSIASRGSVMGASATTGLLVDDMDNNFDNMSIAQDDAASVISEAPSASSNAMMVHRMTAASIVDAGRPPTSQSVSSMRFRASSASSSTFAAGRSIHASIMGEEEEDPVAERKWRILQISAELNDSPFDFSMLQNWTKQRRETHTGTLKLSMIVANTVPQSSEELQQDHSSSTFLTMGGGLGEEDEDFGYRSD